MTNNSPIWPAQLDHLRLNSDDPAMLADYYATVFGYHQSDLPEGGSCYRVLAAVW